MPEEIANGNNGFDLSNQNLIDGYGGNMSSTASQRSFIDIQPNISVRTEMNKRDYYRFRTGEAIPDDTKGVIKMCMEAYDKVGIIKNVIDLMGDFASQGITLVHPDPKIQKFYRSWWKCVQGVERSERFLNTLYRCGNVILKRRYAKISKKTREKMAKAQDMVEIEELETERNLIPFKYDILNPVQVSVKGGVAGVFFGKPQYVFNISTLISSSLKEKENANILKSLPDSLRKAVLDDKNKLLLDSKDLMVYHYKKDDWQLWAHPLIYAILDDIVMFEKMKLADMAALDGAISNIRLWRLGDLEHKIMPSRTAVDKLRDILASNVGGGTMDLVWGPELDFKESNTQIYKFLGDQKYIPVLNSIYAGLGIPPTLTGIAGQSGGYTNNYVSLKTLIDRLAYGRALLEDFWNREIKMVQKALGFNLPAKIRFAQMLSSDENAANNLLIALADRGFISVETLRERLGEDNDLETLRTQKEYKYSQRDKTPPQAGPFRNANLEGDLLKIALQKGLIGIQDVTDIEPEHALPLDRAFPIKQDSPKPAGPNGRPKYGTDTKPRKQRQPLPKTKPKMTQSIMWSSFAFEKVSASLEPVLLDYFGKANLRNLTREEKKLLLDTQMSVFSNLKPFAEITDAEMSLANQPINRDFKQNFEELVSDFVQTNNIVPTHDQLKHLIALSYVITFSEDF